jgi:hypothetical protein
LYGLGNAFHAVAAAHGVNFEFNHGVAPFKVSFYFKPCHHGKVKRLFFMLYLIMVICPKLDLDIMASFKIV